MKRFLSITIFLTVILGSCAHSQNSLDIPLYQQQTKQTCWAATLRSVIKHYKKFDIKECELIREINKVRGINLDCCLLDKADEAAKKEEACKNSCKKAPAAPERAPTPKTTPPEGSSKDASSEGPLDANTDVLKGKLKADITVDDLKNPIVKIFFLQYCRRGGNLVDVMIAVEAVFKLKYTFHARPLTFDEIVYHVDQGHMILAGRTHPTGGGHINFIVGYNKEDKTILVNEVTIGLPMVEDYNKWQGSLWKGIWDASIVITDHVPDAPTCNWVFGRLFCIENPKPGNMIKTMKKIMEGAAKLAKKEAMKKVKELEATIKKELSK